MLDIVTSSPGFRLYQARSSSISLMLAEKTVPPFLCSLAMCPVSLYTKHLSSFFNFSISSLLRRFFPKVEAEADEPREELVLAAAARWPAVWNVDGFLAVGFFSVLLIAQVTRILLSSLTKAR